MKRVIPFLLLLGLSLQAWTQNEADALRYSQQGLVGTARSLGMGGAFSAVGADVTAGALNPAGLALFRSSKFVISPAFRINETAVDYLNGGGSDSKSNFGIQNWGYVVNKRIYYDNGRERKEVERGLKAWTFAFGQNQMENYHRHTIGSGFNPYSSISQSFAQNAQGLYPDQLGDYSNELMAFNLLVIDTILNRDGRSYYPAVTDGQIQQTVQRLEEGRRNEIFLAFAGNFEDKFYIGGSVGWQRLQYSQRFTIQEQDINSLYEFYDPDPDNGFPLEIPSNEIRFSEWYGTTGNGINAKIGVIVRPTDQLRISLNVQSPTYFALTDTFNAQMVHVIDTETGTEEFASPVLPRGEFSYRLSTPYRLTAGLMYLFGKSGFVTADLEFVDYNAAILSTSAPLGSDSYYGFEPENENIQTLYSPSVNLRLGGEYRIDIFRLRGGFAYYGNMLSEAGASFQDFNNLADLQTLDASRKFFTLGFGVRQPNYFVDVAYVNQQYKDKYSPYTLEDPNFFSPTVINNSMAHNMMLTFGFNF